MVDRNELLLEFAGFIETAGKASYQLQTYNIRIGGTVDHILAINRWTKRALEDIALRDSSRGAVQSFFGDKLQWLSNRSGSSEKALVKQYIQHTGRVQEKINKVIAEAEDLLGVLNNLDQRLEVIRGIVDDENGQAMQSKEEILTQLWTMVGGNRGELSKTNRRLKLLGEVGQYRQNAYAHVSNTITRLQQIGGALQQLQEHVGAPELDEEDSDVPFVVHLETIQSGIERLEASRNQARRLQDDYWKKFREGDYAEWSRLS
ncbi:MAG: hypothetical protein M1816_006621 [Peltula sp. TS41687]|nr:MAG: hypothetical protein M1816_006621 [Peltula sp. TS41687]